MCSSPRNITLLWLARTLNFYLYPAINTCIWLCIFLDTFTILQLLLVYLFCTFDSGVRKFLFWMPILSPVSKFYNTILPNRNCNFNWNFNGAPYRLSYGWVTEVHIETIWLQANHRKNYKNPISLQTLGYALPGPCASLDLTLRATRLESQGLHLVNPFMGCFSLRKQWHG